MSGDKSGGFNKEWVLGETPERAVAALKKDIAAAGRGGQG